MIPKIIYVFWHSEEIPPFSMSCLNLLKKNNINWVVKVYHYKDILLFHNLPFFITDYENRKKEHININKVLIDKLDYYKRVSDWFRLYILYNFGGLYIDINCICLKNFDKLIDENSNKLLGFSYPNRNVICMENWFLCSNKKNIFVAEWLKETEEAYINMNEYCEVNYIYSDNNALKMLPYLSQHLAWMKINKTKEHLRKYYHFIMNAIDTYGPYGWIKKFNKNSIWDLLLIPQNNSFLNHIFFFKLRSGDKADLDFLIKINKIPTYSFLYKLLNLSNKRDIDTEQIINKLLFSFNDDDI